MPTSEKLFDGSEFDYTLRAKTYRQDYRGEDLEGFTRQTAQDALSLWEKINNRKVDQGENITSGDYRDFAKKVGKLGSNVITLAASWNHSGDSVLQRYGGIILWSQSVEPILGGIDRLKEAHPEVNFDEEELIQKGIVTSLGLFGRLKDKRRVPGILQDVGNSIVRDGNRVVRERTQEYSSIPSDELEQGEFVTANSDSTMDPYEEAERANLHTILLEVLTTLSPRHAQIIKRRFLSEDLEPVTLGVVANEGGVTRERIRQVEAKALTSLRYPHRAKRYIDFARPVTVPVEFKSDEARKQESIRYYWNGVINAVHLQDEARARHVIARLKVSQIPESWSLSTSLIRMLEDPNYPIATGAVLTDYLRRFTNNPEAILQQLATLEFGEGYLFDQIRKMEKVAGIQRREPIIIPSRSQESPRPKVVERPQEPARDGSSGRNEQRQQPQPNTEQRNTPRPETPPAPSIEPSRPNRITEVINQVAAWVGLKLILGGLSKDGCGIALLSDRRGLVIKVYQDRERHLALELKRLGRVDFNTPIFSDPDHGIYRYAQINRIIRITSQGNYYRIENLRETLYHERP